MKNLIAIVPILVFAIVAMGADGCSVTADTDALTYDLNATGVTTVYNETSEAVYLPGCSAYNIEKLEGTVWTDQGPAFICVWEGIAVKVEAGATFETPMTATEAGTFRLHYTVGHGCTDGEPMSSAECESFEDVYTNQYEVIAPAATCDYYGATFAAGDSFPAFDGCNTCQCMEDGTIACTEMACLCSGDEWYANYVSNDVEECQVIKYMCAPHQFPFSNECGCGCRQAPWCPQWIDCMPPADAECTELPTLCPFSSIAW